MNPPQAGSLAGRGGDWNGPRNRHPPRTYAQPLCHQCHRGTCHLCGGSTGALLVGTGFAAWGVIRSSSGAQGTRGFAGERLEPEVGHYHLRAHQDAPGLGRFFGRGPLSPNMNGAQGYEPFADAASTPHLFK